MPTEMRFLSLSNTPLDPHDRIGPQQLQRRLRAVEGDRALAHRLDQQLGDARDVGLEAGLERLVRRQARADAAQLLPQDGAVKLQLAAPECLAAEGIPAESRPPPLEEILRVVRILSSNSSRGACWVLEAGFVSTPFGRGMQARASATTTTTATDFRFRIWRASRRCQCGKVGTPPCKWRLRTSPETDRAASIQRPPVSVGRRVRIGIRRGP